MTRGDFQSEAAGPYEAQLSGRVARQPAAGLGINTVLGPSAFSSHPSLFGRCREVFHPLIYADA
jgi:hypothetical protein